MARQATGLARWLRHGLIALVLAPAAAGSAHGQTNPPAQPLPYAVDFRTLAPSSTSYPTGWQGWINGASGAAYLATGPTADQGLIASSTASTSTAGVHNYNGKMGVLDNGPNDYGLALSINTTGASGVVVRYEAMTIRNPYDGASNTRINEVSLQYRVGASGAWTTLAGTAYQNNTTVQTGSGVVTPQNIEYRAVTLPGDCDNRAVVQLRWAQRQVSGSGSRPSFAIDNVAVQQPPAGGQATALQFDGVDDYVTFGQAPALGTSTFTIETWFRRTGTGVSTSTGSGGITSIVPLVAKGLAEADGTTADMNYILGINTSGNVIAADFEEGTGQASPGTNHPVSGTTAIPLNTWCHAAATFDGTTMRLYLNGVLEGTTVVGAGRLPQSSSIQHATLATALNSTGGIGSQTLGLFQGQLDEARIWNVARSACDINASMNLELTGGAGLVARWGMHDGAGSVLGNSLATPSGILMNGPAWVPGSPFNAPIPSPVAPDGLIATALDGVQISLSWVDHATDETAYEVERSSTGPGGPFTLVATLAANANATIDAPLSAGTEYCYRVRATTACAASGYSDAACATTMAEACNALRLEPDGAGTDAYVNFGNPAALQLNAMTIEMWMRRDGPGVGVTTGGGGISDIVPLVAKGRSQGETSTQDINYIFGFRASTGVLGVDFEEGPGGASPSLNHPLTGNTAIGTGTWHHVAATYDGTTMKLYLDGVLEGTSIVGQPMASTNVGSVALGSALNTSGVAAGFFDGAVDEVRIWNVARTQNQLQADINTQITTPQTGLVARWALNEGTGTAVYGTAGTMLHGTIVGSAGSNWSRTACAPFNVSVDPPDAPTGLTATPVTFSRIDLSWTDASNDETGFEVEVSTTGVAGSYAHLATLGANVTGYSDTGLSPLTEYCYRVRAVNGYGSSSYADPGCATTPPFESHALGFSGSSAQPSYASFGNPAALQLSAVTIEMWVRRDGAGEGTSTGSGGISDVIPLVAKGRAEAESPAADINYLFGIRASTGVLCADFEEGAGGVAPSTNHPIVGITPLAFGTWYHVAATYDGTIWKLYLNGEIDASFQVDQPLASASNAPVTLASALNTSNVAAGFFNGLIDEVRIWNVVREEAQIQATVNAQISTPTPGLVARWSMDEGAGNAIGASAGTTANGTITGPNYAWMSPGAPFDLLFNQPPNLPVLVAPADGATGMSTSPTLSVTASDTESGPLTVSFYGRPVGGAPGPDFTLIGLPDTQYYTAQLNGGSNAIFESQTSWVAANRASRNIVYVAGLGDCVQNGDNGGNDIEWERADDAFSLLENPATTGLPEGVPYGLCVGNHDQSPLGDADGTTTLYNQFFGTARFSGRAYYGGHYGTNNDNWYELFSASGLDFIVISLEYDQTPDAAVLSWADNLLATNPNRRGIILSHFIINTGNPGGFGPQGQAIYNALRARPNLDIMMCGHVSGEGRRQDTINGNTVHTILADYSGRTAGGNGWLRILEFSPANNEIRVKTYSPWLDQFENDGDSQFILPYDMAAGTPFQLIGTVSGVPSGSNASVSWSGLNLGTAYEWYATVSDGHATTVGTGQSFTTSATPIYSITATAGANGSIAPGGAVAVAQGANQTFTFTPSTNYHVAAVTVDGAAAPVAASYTFTNVQANHTIDVQFALDTWTITATAGASGSIAPSGAVVVNGGADQSFTFAPAANHHVATVTVDGQPAPVAPSYTFTNVVANHTIDVQFALDTWTITATAGANGSITPSGAVAVNHGADQTFTFTPAANHHVAAVTVDGTPVAPAPSYTFTSVQASHTIDVQFAIDLWTITATAGANGSIAPTGAVSVNGGADTTFTFTPAAGYHVSLVAVDGAPVAPAASYTFTSVVANHTIDVQFTIDVPLGALAFDGASRHVTFGPATELGVSTFTLELWFRKTGAGVTTSTGDGGVVAVPLVTKGRDEADGDDRDVNYFLGIDAAGHLVADYEEGAGPAPGLSHPVVGSTVIADDAWYHGAVVFDGSALRLYLNGVADGVTAGLSGRNPQSSSIQHAMLATAANSIGETEGYFQGEIDEPRIWSIARTQCQIVASMNAEVPSGEGLLGRWGLNEGAGPAAGNSVEGSPNGTLVGGPVWVPGAPFDLTPPVVPPPPGPDDLVALASPGLVHLTWADHATSETGFEVERSTTGSGGTFSLITTVGPDVTSYLDRPLAGSPQYCYRVRAVGCAGASGYSTVACATLAVGVDDLPVTELEASPLGPHPIRGRIHFQFALPQDSEVKLEVLDVRGRRLAVLADGACGAGRHEVTWNGSTGGGSVGNGVYFMRFRGMGREITKRFVVLR